MARPSKMLKLLQVTTIARICRWVQRIRPTLTRLNSRKYGRSQLVLILNVIKRLRTQIITWNCRLVVNSPRWGQISLRRGNWKEREIARASSGSMRTLICSRRRIARTSECTHLAKSSAREPMPLSMRVCIKHRVSVLQSSSTIKLNLLITRDASKSWEKSRFFRD